MSAPLADDLRAAIRTALAETGTSQAGLARAVGITPKHAGEVLRGQSALSVALAEEMLAALGYQPTLTIVRSPR